MQTSNHISNCSLYGSTPLNDHDYCSPNKNQSSRHLATTKDTVQQQTNETSQDGHDQRSQSTMSASECLASTSSSPNDYNKNDAESVSNLNPKKWTNEDSNISDNDSSSSSSITSDDSTMNLIIAPGGQEHKSRSLAPKDTPSVSKPRLGRRPSLKTDFETSKQQQQQKKRKRQHPEQPQSRAKRQNTSVTDKSQWITGDEQIDTALSEHLSESREKRQRKEVHDPLYSHFTSSDYSSSDAESDQNSEYDSENDPERPWCICNKPDDGAFMLECEICKYWFHGACVGMTDSLSKRYEKDKREWFCTDCEHALELGTPRHAIPRRVVKKEKKSGSKSSGRRRGRPKKSASPTREPSARISLRSTRKMNDMPETRRSSRGVQPKPTSRSECFEKFGEAEQLKKLIKEKKRSFFLKYRQIEQLKDDNIKKSVLGRKPMTATLGDSLDSVVTNTNSPNMNYLPIAVKSESKERSKPSIVLQINTKKDDVVDSSGQSPSVNSLPQTTIKSEIKERSKPNIVLQINTKKDDAVDPTSHSPNVNSIPTITIKPDNKEISKPNIVLHINTRKEDGVDSSSQRIVTIVKKPIRKTSDEPCWSGTITMTEVGKFAALAKPVSGNLDFMQSDLSRNLLVCGRIAPDQLNSYIKQVKSTKTKQILLIQLHPLTEDDKTCFTALFDYLYTRNRCGVINNSANPHLIKDFYVLPIHETSNIPEICKPIDGPGLDRKEPNCLVGLLVKTTRPPSASSSASGYSPTPISQ